MPTSCRFVKDRRSGTMDFIKEWNKKESNTSDRKCVQVFGFVLFYMTSLYRNFAILVPDSEIFSSMSLSWIKWSFCDISSNKSLRSPASLHFLRKATFTIASKNKKNILEGNSVREAVINHFIVFLRRCLVVDEHN